MAQAPNELLTSLLKDVSRSFYLTLRVLPKSIRRQIGLAYLLARTTDTIADTEIVPVEKRLDALREMQAFIREGKCRPLGFGEFVNAQSNPAERELLKNREYMLALLATDFSSVDKKLIKELLEIITSGQELDLHRFSNASTAKITALQNDAELDDYTYRVAGCVGKFWTDMCIEHLFRLPELDLAFSGTFEDLGVRFGKGLQLVNILRDLPADLQNGRCYIPADKLADAGLAPADLLSSANEAKFRPLYNRYLDLAKSHLTAGWEYTNLIPFTWMSLRLACAWPVLIGLRTIDRLRTGNVLDGRHRIKISRAEVRNVILQSVVCYPLPRVWRNLARLKESV